MARALATADFARPPRPALTGQPVIARFAGGISEAISKGLSGLRSAPWQINADGVQEVIDVPVADQDAAILRFESDRGSLTALLAIDRQAMSALFEAAMGGTGAEQAFPMVERPLSKIEKALLRLIQAAIGKELASMLSGIAMRPFSLFAGREAPELDGKSGLVILRFVLNVFSYSGEILLAFSRDELEREVMSADAEQAREDAASHKMMLQREMGKSEVTLTITLGDEMLTLEALADLSPGRLITLAATAGAPVSVWSGDVAAYEAMLIRNGDRLAVTITAVNS